MTIKPEDDLSYRRDDNINENLENNGQNEPEEKINQQAKSQEVAGGDGQQEAKSKQETEAQEDRTQKAEAQEIDTLKKLLEDKQREVEEYKNRWLRAQADFDNYRKRMQREIHDINLYAGEQLIKDILPVIDNFERALSSVEASDDAFYKGVKLIYQQIMDIFNRHEIKEIEAVGKPFDPNFHEAVMTIEDPERESNTVAEVLMKGYTYHAKVIRPSMVKVVKN